MYQILAKYYDRLMAHMPYEDWINKIQVLISQYYKDESLTIADLGCGTGAITLALAQLGHQVIGIDASEAMLMMAKDKSTDHMSESILWVHQDIKDLNLARPMDLMVSMCDTMNYMLDTSEFERVLVRVCEFLQPMGLFIFDLNTQYHFQNFLDDQIFVEHFDDLTYILDNHFDETEQIHEYEVTFFEKKGACFRKHQEWHYEKAYQPETIIEICKANGFEVLSVVGDETDTSLETARKHYYTLRKIEASKAILER